MSEYVLPYGVAICPSCEGYVDLSITPRGFTLPPTRGSKELLHYCLCDSCASTFEALSAEGQETKAKEIVRQHVENSKNGAKTGYAVVTLTALLANNGNLLEGIENGVNVPMELCELIVQGVVDPYDIIPLLWHMAHSHQDMSLALDGEAE